MENINWIQMVFLTFLAAAAWQDLRKRSVSVWLYFGYGAAGTLIRLYMGGLGFMSLGGMLVGAGLLAAGRIAGGRIGSGDGWFFVVGGFYLSFYDTLRLFLFGALAGGLFCLFFALHGMRRGKNMYGVPVPFLPFLVPAWIGMVLL